MADRQANCKLAFADGKFSGELVAGKPSAASVNYLAYYPYSSTSGDGYMVSNEIANIQYMPFDGTSDFMYTDPVANQYDERNMPTDMKLAFAHHLFGIVEVNVNSTDDNLKGEKILLPNYSQEKSGLEELRLLIAGAWLFVAAGFTLNVQRASDATLDHFSSDWNFVTISSEAHQISPSFGPNDKVALTLIVGT